jgi:AcrR family transcriptional regulator
MPSSDVPAARDRILATAYDLLARRDIRDVGIDEVVDKAAVANTPLYRHFPSKDDLVVDPERRLLGFFDIFDDWFSPSHAVTT